MGVRRPRSALRVEVDVEQPLDDIAVARGFTRVLLIVRQGDAVVGHIWLPAARRIPAATVWQAITHDLGEDIVHRTLRRRLERVLDRPGPAEAAGLDVSVIVCTRDRPEQLGRCLDSLAALATAPREIVVVDNAPSDDRTRALCDERGVRYVLEPTPGQTRARNRGIVESEGALVAFTDDDCVVDPHWLDTLPEAFADPLVMVATGYIGPLEVDGEAQYLFELHGGFERHPRHTVFSAARTAPILAAGAAGAGANMVFRRACFAHTGLFAEDLGPGTPARSSDDKYAFYLALRHGFRIDYDPRRIVWHVHRREHAALLRILNDYGVSEFAYSWRCLVEHRDTGALRVWRWWLRHFARDLRRWLRRHPDAVPLTLTWQEIRGALSGPAAMRRSRRSRAAIPPIVPQRSTAPRPRAAAVVASEAPDVSVTVASYDRRERLCTLLVRLAEQDTPRDRFEVVVVLDGSTDGSAETVRGLDLPFTPRVVEQPHRGLAAARNRGALEARHPVVLFVDDDIEPEPQWIAAHATGHAAARRPGIVLGSYPPALRPEDWWGQQLRAWWEDHFRRKGAPGHRWSMTDVLDGNLSVPRELFDELGRFDERFRGGRRQDYELGLRVLRDRVPMSYRAEACGRHCFDARLDTSLRNAHAEGLADVQLIAKHPEARFALPLGRYVAGERLPRLLGLRLAAVSPQGQAAGVALAGALEAAGRYERWRVLTTVLMLSSYLRGVRDALGGERALADYLLGGDGTERRDVTVDLTASAVPVDGTLAPDERWSIAHASQPVASLAPILPGLQWDWENVLERGASAAALPLVTLLAQRDGAENRR